MAPSSAWRADAVADVRAGAAVWRNLCLKRVRTLLGIPAKYPSAIIAWTHVARADRHPGKQPPRGVPVFWRGGKYGHVALSDGGGWCFSTDIKRRGRLDRVRIDLVTQRWGYDYLGWTETLNGVRVYEPERRRPTLRQGSRGTAVRDLQRALGILADGDFGPVTEAAVNRLKGRHDLPRDGIAGPRVWALLEGDD